ncbi:MAG: preprotein translocase subunit SecG [Candidatus Marinimicrobia bacterium]|nr:preprotein translocase subunit SecG [Candidatus Neomarinimicrobiota bacterium]RPG05887.1 MAG: preprotein translocase subunit SecG [Pelagibacteraceae bacterium TMED247]|tara:strand:+ start:116 stop:421 length:306 start_codon:yes stop_codon:yes gene_type:complete
METILIAANVILAIILILLILLQRSEGGALGLGLSQDNFASTRSVGNFLTKSTAVIATLFIISSILLVVLSRGDLESTQSVLEKVEEKKDSDTPQIPESSK